MSHPGSFGPFFIFVFPLYSLFLTFGPLVLTQIAPLGIFLSPLEEEFDFSLCSFLFFAVALL